MTREQQRVEEDRSDTPLIVPQEIPTLAVPETEAPLLVSAQSEVLEDHHWDFAAFEEEYIRSYIALADTKAAWAFTIASGMLAFLFSQDSSQILLLNPTSSHELVLLLAGVALLGLSGFCSFRVVAPRLKSHSGEGVVFFGAVAAHESADSYVSAVAARDKRSLTEARLKHCYDTSRICTVKYLHLKWAIWLGLPGLILAVGYLLLD